MRNAASLSRSANRNFERIGGPEYSQGGNTPHAFIPGITWYFDSKVLQTPVSSIIATRNGMTARRAIARVGRYYDLIQGGKKER